MNPIRSPHPASRFAAVEALIAERGAARAMKDWAASDRTREALAAMGVAVKDNKDGTMTWTVAS